MEETSLQPEPGRRPWTHWPAIALFGLIAVANKLGWSDGFDTAVRSALRLTSDAPHWLQTGVRDATALGGYTVLTLVVVMGTVFLARLQRYRDAAFLVTAAVAGMLATTTLKAIFSRARPDELEHLVTVDSYSFPSSHSFMATVVFVAIARVAGQRVLIFSAVIALLVGLSRVALGVHWPTDVLAGWCAGYAWVILLEMAFTSQSKWRSRWKGDR